LPPPATLTPAQAEVWRSVVSGLPGDWFSTEHTALLAQYCRHTARADAIEARLAELAVDDPDFGRLAKLAVGETAKIAMLARSMRLTQQSRLKAETAANRATTAPRGIDALLGDRHE
jgi:hypothetical protein